MEYGFAEVHGKEIFRSVPGLSGKQAIVEEHEDSTITHRFTIDGVVRTQGGSTWYIISARVPWRRKSSMLCSSISSSMK